MELLNKKISFELCKMQIDKLNKKEIILKTYKRISLLIIQKNFPNNKMKMISLRLFFLHIMINS